MVQIVLKYIFSIKKFKKPIFLFIAVQIVLMFKKDLIETSNRSIQKKRNNKKITHFYLIFLNLKLLKVVLNVDEQYPNVLVLCLYYHKRSKKNLLIVISKKNIILIFFNVF